MMNLMLRKKCLFPLSLKHKISNFHVRTDVALAGIILGTTAAATAVGAFLIISNPANSPIDYHNHPSVRKNNKFFIHNGVMSTNLLNPFWKRSRLLSELSSSLFTKKVIVECSADDSNSFSESDHQVYDLSNQYQYIKMDPPSRAFSKRHALFETLSGAGLVERYYIYRKVETVDAAHDIKNHGKKEIAIADAQIGNKLNGHRGIVHGGIISLLFDDAMGWGYEALLLTKKEQAKNLVNGQREEPNRFIVTANLNIDFRKPLKEGSPVIIRIFHEKTDKRKIHFSARMESPDGEILYSEAKALFIQVTAK